MGIILEKTDITMIFRNHQMYDARMISGSKSGYRGRYPKNDVVFNANIFTPSNGRVWYGDLDITFDNKVLQEICNEIGEEMIVVSEMFGRFGAENRPYEEIFKNAHVKFTPNSKTYNARVYGGIEGVTIDNMTIITSKGIDWVKKKIKRKYGRNK